LALRKDELLKRSLQEKYLYILVDEHQDTNDSQNLIVKTLADFFETPNLFVVGDEKQAIYRFQGASVENFLGFQKIWNQMKIISLTENYRSHQSILDASFGMIEKNYTDDELSNLRVKLSAGSKIKETPLEVISAPDIETEECNLVNTLKGMPADKNAAIIVRKNNDVTRIFRLLEEEGVEASAERGASIFDHPIGISAFSLFASLIDPSDIESLALTFATGLWDLDFESSAQMIQNARSGNLKNIEDTLPIIKSLRGELQNSGAIEFLILAGEESGLTKIASKDPLSVEVWRSIISLSEDLTRAGDIEDTITLIKELLNYKKSAEKRSIKIKTGSIKSKITIMTAHSSKGLEFDYVFLPYTTEESWIKKSRGSSFVLPKEKGAEDDLRDDRRLFYVALTRAKEKVVISFHNEASASIITPLRFIDELDQKLLSKKEIEKSRRRGKQTILSKKDNQKKELVEYSKRVLEEKGLSVTALNHFIKCPSEFFYKSILKIPEAPSGSSEKGNAMHEAMANVWRDRVKNEKEMTKIITYSVTNYFKNSLLSKNDKEAALEELLESAPKVAKALVSHFNQEGVVNAEGWFENVFEHKIEDKKIELRIHGKLDAILEQDKKVLIYDYKTKEVMREKAIKGETKGDDGNYFRQLVFYKILLQDNPRFKDKEIEPALVFIKPNNKGECPTISLPISNEDIENVKTEIKNLTESVWSGSLVSDFCENQDCKFCALKKLRV
jgi:DNA helicase-2/ATP-dependent DNA helicase PcrA